MEAVTLKAFVHRQQGCIGIVFDPADRISRLIMKIKGIKWSRTNQCWYIPLDRYHYDQLADILKDRVQVDRSLLYAYLEKKAVKGGSANSHSKKDDRKISMMNKVAVIKEKIDAANAHVLPVMTQRLKLKAYSSSTIKTYLNEMSQLLRKLGRIPADELTPDHLRRYLVYCFEKSGLSENTLHSRINALKFYYEQVLGREKFFWEIPRPKKQLQLPRFFNRDEITAIIRSISNIKHKTMIMLSYAAGLRVSEVVNVRIKDIDSSRMCILIRQAKGKKDRLVRLSPVLLVMLREYWKENKPRDYLFPGQDRDEHYSSRALQMVLADAKQKAGVLKPGSIHALRHSFATHLLDKGTDVTMIMKLLGHNDIRTTLRYLHVTNRDILQVISPLDGLDL